MSRPCICGRSAALPLCDGSHADEDWSCAAAATPARSVVLTSPTLAHLGQRLAARDGATALVAGDPLPERARVTALVTPSDLLTVHAATRALPDLTVVGLGLPAALVAARFPDARALAVAFEHAPGLFREICRALDGEDGEDDATARAPLPSLFLSHAVDDEPALAAPVEYLRTAYGADVFLCADSIPAGGDWHASICAAIEHRDRFVQVVSPAARASTFCAFEAGAAIALGKPIRLLTLDGTPPPAHLQHLQAACVVRHRATRPWLTEADALVELLVTLAE